MKIDGRILDTDNRFRDYCRVKHIKDPFRERQEKFSMRVRQEERDGFKITVIRDQTEEEKEAEREWSKRRDEFLHTFRTFGWIIGKNFNGMEMNMQI